MSDALVVALMFGGALIGACVLVWQVARRWERDRIANETRGEVEKLKGVRNEVDGVIGTLGDDALRERLRRSRRVPSGNGSHQ